MKTVQPGSPASPVPMNPLPSASFQTLPLMEPSVGVKFAKSATPGVSLLTVVVTATGCPGDRFQPDCSTSVTRYVPTLIDGNEYAPTVSVTVDGSPAFCVPSLLRSRKRVQPARDGGAAA